MKRLYILLAFAVLLLSACSGALTPDVKGTVAAAIAATQAARPTKTPTAVPEPSETPVPTTTPADTAAPTATSTPVADDAPPPDAPTPTLPAGEIHAVVGVTSDDVLNVRARAGVNHPIVGTIPFYGTRVQVTGDGTEVAGWLWVPIRYAQVSGWVNSYYLARQVGSAEESVAARAAAIVLSLRDRDLERLSRYVHPEVGVRFSPYTYVRTGDEPPEDRDLVFTAGQIAGLASDRTVHHWGRFDGSGDPIELPFWAYWERFIYDADFAHPHVVGYDEFVGRGNTINNIADAYPGDVTVEYHFQGFDPKFAGMDWRSLRLVLEEQGGTWYLVGIVHDEWTT